MQVVECAIRTSGPRAEKLLPSLLDEIIILKGSLASLEWHPPGILKAIPAIQFNVPFKRQFKPSAHRRLHLRPGLPQNRRTEGSAADELVLRRRQGGGGRLHWRGRQDGLTLLHGGVANGHAQHLPRPDEGVLLDVLHAMLLAHALHQRLQLAVLQGRHVGEHVVLDLVVEPAVHPVDKVRAGLKVGRGVGAAQEPLRAVGLARGRVAVQILPGMIAGNDHEGVRVRERLCKQCPCQGPPGSFCERRLKGPEAQGSQDQWGHHWEHHVDHHGQHHEEPLGRKGRPEEGLKRAVLA
mmetsp:Transcript_4052/g.11847  ORF Transcript_4052/g.11847 Transcript_4052/m.11847 type:complete len:295 (-) Transcript_4052:430-1314(-)